MPVLTNISILYQCLPAGTQADLHAIEDAAIAWNDDKISWVGPASELPTRLQDKEYIDAKGQLVIPGLVDSHTHLCFGGWRAEEFEMRCQGARYQDIAEAGGGITSTVKATREASEENLYEKACGFVDQMVTLGVTTTEAKSGYGLSLEDELKQLEVYRRLQRNRPTTIVSTCLGAHIIPPEFRSDRKEYLNLLMGDLIPRVAADGLADFFDIFVEDGAFSPQEARDLAYVASDSGLFVKLHVDQLSDGGGGLLAAEVGAVSADHLEYTSDEGIEAMADAGVVAGCLPLATLYLGETPMRARSFVDAGVPVAVATDFNPGSAPSFHLPLAMMLSCTMCGLTPSEALKGATIVGAQSIQRAGVVGSLEVGKNADFALIDAPGINHWLYHFRPNDVTTTYIRGQLVS